MKRRTRNLTIALLVLVIVGAVALAIALRRREAPEPARLLPESEAIVYLNVKTVRRLTSFGDKPAHPREPEYEEFVNETGFQFERDLDEAAFAVHAANSANNKAPDTRYSEIIIGRFDAQKAAAYLQKISRTTERYRDVRIFNIPVENRTVRVALVGMDTVAVSNTDGAEVIHGMVDRYKQMALPFGGPTLVKEHYGEVPFASLVWAIARISEQSTDPRRSRALTLPGGFDIFVPQKSVVIASARYAGSIYTKADLIAQNEQDAAKFSEQAGAFLEIFRALEGSTPTSGTDQDVKAVFDSLKIEQAGTKATVSATIPVGFFKKLLSDPPIDLGAQPQTTAPNVPEKKNESRKK